MKAHTHINDCHVISKIYSDLHLTKKKVSAKTYARPQERISQLFYNKKLLNSDL